ncbi:hypothetical protein [Methanococcoides burtonii]|uniref:hypothetical protein n=1 Tax=Methanococcoides burtonii TaxID=29291 RepID=UPI000045E201|nr:hypothetical protein [Methanococcoides burtonii]
MQLEITVYNTERSDFPATLFPPTHQIINCDSLEIVSDRRGGLETKTVLSGEAVTLNNKISMKLNRSGNYTLQTTVWHLDVKNDEVETLEFYRDFHVNPNDGEDSTHYPYITRYPIFDFENTPWTMGNKYNLVKVE